MRRSPVEIVGEIYAEWARGDFGGSLDRYDPRIVYTTFAAEGDELRLEGLDAMVASNREFFAQWRDFRIEAEHIVEVGAGTVLVVGQQSGEGRSSGARIEMPVFAVWRFRDGRAVEFFTTRHREEALGSAGVTELELSRLIAGAPPVERPAPRARTAGRLDTGGEAVPRTDNRRHARRTGVTEFEWETKASRQEVADLLRRIADGLADEGEVEIEQDGWELKLKVPDEVELELEYEVEDDEVELEIELSWSRSHGGSGDEEEDEDQPGAGDDESAGGEHTQGPPAGGL